MTRIASILIAAGLIASKVEGGIFLSDNFSGNTLDPNKWTANTSLSDVYGVPMIAVTNQSCQLTARAYLNTVTNYDPAAPGGISVSGTWKFVNDSGGGADGPWIATRSSGVPSSYYVASGEVTDGINFRLGVPLTASPPNAFSIAGNGAATVTSFNVVSNTLNMMQGDSANFVVTDDGTNLTYYMVKVGDPTQAAYATAVCTNHLSPNKISFYNREYSTDVAAVENVVIQTIVTGPQLNIAPAGKLSVLFWTASGTNYVLQSTTNPSSTNWVTVTDAVPVIAFTVTNQSPARYFRLQSQ